MNPLLSRPKLAIVIPVLDDWECLAILSGRLSEVLRPLGMEPLIVAVDDGSSPSAEAREAVGASIVLRLVRNVGHQRAIAIGLDHVLSRTDADLVAVMDGDGEDRPEDLPLLLAQLGAASRGRIVVASRRRRSEGRRFRAFYRVYKTTFRLLTGAHLDFGNFGVFDRAAGLRLVSMHELWLNLPATMMRSRLELSRVPTDRGRRYAGRSRMNLVGLVVHGLSAVGVFVERAFTRVLLAITSLAVLLLLGLVVGLILKTVGLATPGWVTTIAAALVIVLVQTAMVALSGLFIAFGNASNVTQAPSSTAHSVVASVEIRPGNVSAVGPPAVD